MWAYIDRKLVVDLGNIFFKSNHNHHHKLAHIVDVYLSPCVCIDIWFYIYRWYPHKACSTVDLDTLGLTEDMEYDFHMFHAERQTVETYYKVTLSNIFLQSNCLETDCGSIILGGDTGSSFALGGPEAVGVTLAALLLLFGLLWFFWPLLFGSSTKKAATTATHAASSTTAATKPTVPVVVGATTKKWKTVDTSNYVWSGSTPMKTNWGELGATSSAPTAGAEHKEVEITVPVYSKTARAAAGIKSEGPTCGICSALYANCSEFYAKCASMRPQR